MLFVRGKIEKARDKLVLLNQEIKQKKFLPYSKESKKRVKEIRSLIGGVLYAETKALDQLRILQNKINSFDNTLKSLAGVKTDWFRSAKASSIMDEHPDWALENVKVLLEELDGIKNLAKAIFKLEEKQ